jgi:anti-anti-sigma factor
VVRGEEGDRLQRTVLSLKNALIIIDLSQVKEIDAGGLGALVALQRWAKDSQRTLRLLNPSRKLQGILELTGLNVVLDIASEPSYAFRRSA